jgi:predicted phosphodiesterase
MPRRFLAALVAGASLVALLLAGCTSKALVTEEYQKDFYQVDQSLPDSIPDARYSFLVYGDSQSGWRAERFIQPEQWMSWKQLYLPGIYPLYLLGKGLLGAGNWARGVPDYGTEQRRAIQKVLVRAADRLEARFVMHLGDIAANDGRKAWHWGYFLRDNKRYASPIGRYPFLPVPGNHDYINTEYGLKNWQAIFDRPLFYVQDSPSAAIFFLNSNYIIDQHQQIDDARQEALFRKWFVSADSSETPSWLERQLEKREDRPFKIVAMHHSLISFSWHHSDWYNESFGPDLAPKRDALIRLLQKYDVQVVMSGHEHLYEHSLTPSPGGAAGQTPLHTVITSGGGVPPRETASPAKVRKRRADFRRSGFDVSLKKQVSRYHYTRVNVTPDTLTLLTYGINAERGRRTGLIERIRIAAPPAQRRKEAEGRARGASAGAQRAGTTEPAAR